MKLNFIDTDIYAVLIKNRNTFDMFFMIHCEPVIFALCLQNHLYLNH